MTELLPSWGAPPPPTNCSCPFPAPSSHFNRWVHSRLHFPGRELVLNSAEQLERHPRRILVFTPQDNQVPSFSRFYQANVHDNQQNFVDCVPFFQSAGKYLRSNPLDLAGKGRGVEVPEEKDAACAVLTGKAAKCRYGIALNQVRFPSVALKQLYAHRLLNSLEQGHPRSANVGREPQVFSICWNHSPLFDRRSRAKCYGTKICIKCYCHPQYRLRFLRDLGIGLANSVLDAPIWSNAFAVRRVHFSKLRIRCFSSGRRAPKCYRTSKFGNLSKFRLNAQGGNPRRSWWKRLLFEQVDSDSFLDFDFDAGGDFDVTDEMDSGVGRTEDTGKSNNFGGSVSSTEEYADEVDSMLEDDAKFNSWKRRTDALSELREFQESGRDPDNTDWEDWLDDSWGDYSSYVGGKDSGWYIPQPDWEKDGLPRSPPEMPERGMNRTIKELIMRIFERQDEVEDDLMFEERVFRFTSQSTAKFVGTLILIPWLVDFLVHDFVIVPFLNRYVETVPLAAQILDLRKSQKLRIIETLKLERQRVRFEAAIGKAPPLSDEDLTEHVRHKAKDLREELRLENREAFGNLWSDLLAGVTVLLLLVFNPKQVAIMRLTGDRLFTNISDTGKAFIIILLTDIFLGYHSESGWETVIEMFLDHYGFEVDQASVYLFVAIVPVTIDACFKLWVFRYLTRLSPSAAATFREMKRH